jgi:hypothetical protein
VLEQLLAAHALVVDVRAVQAPEVAQHETAVAVFDDAVLFRDDLVEKLNRVVRVATQAIRRTQLDSLLPFGCRQDQTCHPDPMLPSRSST